jgi:hypothetical protein
VKDLDMSDVLSSPRVGPFRFPELTSLTRAKHGDG